MATVKNSYGNPVADAVRRHALDDPNRLALVVGTTKITYEILWAQIHRAVDWFSDKELSDGARIIISTDSRDPYFVSAYFGVHLSGCVAVPTDFRSTEEELTRRQQIVGSSYALFGEQLDSFRRYVCESTNSNIFPEDSRPIEMSAVAEIIFTTGSTGSPKAVALSHTNILASAELLRLFVGNRNDDREVLTTPLTHSFGLGRLRSVLLAGGSLILVPGLVYPQLTIQALQEFAATGLACVPGGMRLLLKQNKASLQQLASQLRYIEMGSAAYSAQEKEQLCEIFPSTRLCMHYGLTEASRSTFSEFHEDFHHLGSVGKPSPGVDIKILDGSGRSLMPGKQGRIHVRAPTVMKGYWNNPDLTDKVLDQTTGWLDTGDLGWLDDQGYIYLAGRADDVINCGGVKILPSEIEMIASRFAGVDDVACVGIPDPGQVLGEVPVVCVVANNDAVGARALSDFIKSEYQGRIASIIVEPFKSLPKSESGKILRQELKEVLNK